MKTSLGISLFFAVGYSNFTPATQTFDTSRPKATHLCFFFTLTRSLPFVGKLRKFKRQKKSFAKTQTRSLNIHAMYKNTKKKRNPLSWFVADESNTTSLKLVTKWSLHSRCIMNNSEATSMALYKHRKVEFKWWENKKKGVNFIRYLSKSIQVGCGVGKWERKGKQTETIMKTVH